MSVAYAAMRLHNAFPKPPSVREGNHEVVEGVGQAPIAAALPQTDKPNVVRGGKTPSKSKISPAAIQETRTVKRRKKTHQSRQLYLKWTSPTPWSFGDVRAAQAKRDKPGRTSDHGKTVRKLQCAAGKLHQKAKFPPRTVDKTQKMRYNRPVIKNRNERRGYRKP